VFNPTNEIYDANGILNGSNTANLDLRCPLIKFDEDALEYVPVDNKPKIVKLELSPSTKQYKLRFNGIPFVNVNEKYMVVNNPKPYEQVFDEYYSKYIELVNEYKQIEVQFNMNLSDIRNFDFYKLIYLKQTGRYYYANKLKYNVASPIVAAELVEIPFN